MLIPRTPMLIKKLLYRLKWQYKAGQKRIFLTFDDGPTPHVTEWVLEQLQAFGAKATFFCIGKNITRYPELFGRILSEGHTVGNHTYTHVNGWHTDLKEYLSEIKQCGELVESPLFRPPYGKITPAQITAIRTHPELLMPKKMATAAETLNNNGNATNDAHDRLRYPELLAPVAVPPKPQIVLWDVISGDYDTSLDKRACWQHILKNAGDGSIVVFHDSIKAFGRLEYALPRTLQHFSSKGFSFVACPLVEE